MLALAQLSFGTSRQGLYLILEALGSWFCLNCRLHVSLFTNNMGRMPLRAPPTQSTFVLSLSLPVFLTVAPRLLLHLLSALRPPPSPSHYVRN